MIGRLTNIPSAKPTEWLTLQETYTGELNNSYQKKLKKLTNMGKLSIVAIDQLINCHDDQLVDLKTNRTDTDELTNYY